MLTAFEMSNGFYNVFVDINRHKPLSTLLPVP
jgi:hypothetical protein